MKTRYKVVENHQGAPLLPTISTDDASLNVTQLTYTMKNRSYEDVIQGGGYLQECNEDPIQGGGDAMKTIRAPLSSLQSAL